MKYSIEQLQAMEEVPIEKTLKHSAEHNYYLDKLENGQYLVSWAEHPCAIYTELNEALQCYYDYERTVL